MQSCPSPKIGFPKKPEDLKPKPLKRVRCEWFSKLGALLGLLFFLIRVPFYFGDRKWDPNLENYPCGIWSQTRKVCTGTPSRTPKTPTPWLYAASLTPSICGHLVPRVAKKDHLEFLFRTIT